MNHLPQNVLIALNSFDQHVPTDPEARILVEVLSLGIYLTALNSGLLI